MPQLVLVAVLKRAATTVMHYLSDCIGNKYIYIRGVKESIYTELALYGSKNEYARTDTVFLPISEVCDGTVSLKVIFMIGIILQV